MRITYQSKRFSPESLAVIRAARDICETYQQQGYDLTLRQLYYQFVARDLLPNTERSYKRLGSIINDARLAGHLDWDYIVDRTRNLRALAHWENPAELVDAAARQFRLDRWAEQPEYVEVWIEKDALVGVLEAACPTLDVPYFSCRGYTSQSELWGAAQRLGGKLIEGKEVTVIHLGDHDPSGIDMTRDIEDRLHMFIWQDVAKAAIGDGAGIVEGGQSEASATVEAGRLASRLSVERIALNMDQVEAYDPPPNPAKITDSRARGYIAEHGGSSWELDALEPTVLTALIRGAVAEHRDEELWEATSEREEEERKALTGTAQRWEEVKDFLGE